MHNCRVVSWPWGALALAAMQLHERSLVLTCMLRDLFFVCWCMFVLLVTSQKVGGVLWLFRVGFRLVGSGCWLIGGSWVTNRWREWLTLFVGGIFSCFVRSLWEPVVLQYILKFVRFAMCTESLHRTLNGLVATDPFSTFHLLRTYGRLVGPVGVYFG